MKNIQSFNEYIKYNNHNQELVEEGLFDGLSWAKKNWKVGFGIYHLRKENGYDQRDKESNEKILKKIAQCGTDLEKNGWQKGPNYNFMVHNLLPQIKMGVGGSSLGASDASVVQSSGLARKAMDMFKKDPTIWDKDIEKYASIKERRLYRRDEELVEEGLFDVISTNWCKKNWKVGFGIYKLRKDKNLDFNKESNEKILKKIAEYGTLLDNNGWKRGPEFNFIVNNILPEIKKGITGSGNLPMDATNTSQSGLAIQASNIFKKDPTIWDKDIEKYASIKERKSYRYR